MSGKNIPIRLNMYMLKTVKNENLNISKYIK